MLSNSMLLSNRVFRFPSKYKYYFCEERDVVLIVERPSGKNNRSDCKTSPNIGVRISGGSLFQKTMLAKQKFKTPTYIYWTGRSLVKVKH